MINLSFVPFFIGILFSFLLLTLFYLTKNKHIQYSKDNDKGPQKIHNHLAIRTGGIIIIPSYLLASYFFEDNQIYFMKLCLVLIPAFLVGLFEDFSKNVSPILRFIAIVITAHLIKFYLGIFLTDFSLFKIENYFLILSLTIIAITTMSNAYNMIDGLNGLALGTGMISFISFFLLALKTGDTNTANLTLFLVFPFIALFTFNFPFGNIFIGDAGAYILGCSVSIVAIVISENNHSINPFCSFLIIIYPLYECIRTFFRRLITNQKVYNPDNQHLHSLVYQLFQYRMLKKYSNPLSSLLILLFPLSSSLWAYLNFNNQNNLIFGIIVFLIIYELITLVVLKKLKNKNFWL